MYKPQVPYTPQIYKNFQTVFGGRFCFFSGLLGGNTFFLG